MSSTRRPPKGATRARGRSQSVPPRSSEVGPTPVLVGGGVAALVGDGVGVGAAVGGAAGGGGARAGGVRREPGRDAGRAWSTRTTAHTHAQRNRPRGPPPPPAEQGSAP